jgi:chemotaxis protein methyltransferase CheR
MIGEETGYGDVIPVSDEVFRLLRDHIKDRCGLFFDESSKFIFERRLYRRLKAYHLQDFRDYYRFLLYDKKRDDEMTVLIDLLTVNETYFFREQNQLRAFTEEVLPELRVRNKGRRRIRIWSAGCATGEEPYTLAMLILEDGHLPGWDIEIIGSDINQRVLSTGRRGVYRKNSFRCTDRCFIDRYFTEDGDALRISDRVKELVHFGHLNLLDPFKVRFLGEMDLIFCRNVLIYFDLETRIKVVGHFYDRIAEGGYLFLGHAESLINISTSFALRHLKHDMVYQKPLGKGVCLHVR